MWLWVKRNLIQNTGHWIINRLGVEHESNYNNMCLLLLGCFGTELIRISGIGIKTGDLITVPHKIETLTKDKNEK
jgi:hypothetical protein